jgi:Protein of unknown function (DUF1579)
MRQSDRIGSRFRLEAVLKRRRGEMKRVLTLGAAFAVLAGGATTTLAQGPPMPQPTAEHQRLKQDVGTWDAQIKMWMGPGEPMVSQGTETVSMVGPFWQVSTFEGSMMGETFTGKGWMGWDPEKKQYVSAWVDSTTPTISHGSATWDEATKSYTGSMDGVGPDGSVQTIETTVSYPEEGKRVLTMKVGGQTTMEIVYTKK